MAPQCVDGLEAALAAASLSKHVAAAAEWCERMGPRDLDEIAEDDVFEDLASDLKLKPLDRRRLQKELCGSAAPLRTASTGSGQDSGAAANAIFSAVRKADDSKNGSAQQPLKTDNLLFVKNTFLDLDGDSRPADALRKMATEPPQRWDDATRACAEVEELLKSGSVEEEPSEEEQGEEAAPEAATPTCGLYRVTTYDGYDSVDQWVWAGGDPNKPPTVPEETAAGQGEEDVPQQATAASSQPQQQQPASRPRQQHQQLLPEQQPMVGMVMVPAEAMQGYPMAMAAPGGWSFPGCVAVPMNRFEGWPNDLASAGTASAPMDGSRAAGQAPIAPRRPMVLGSTAQPSSSSSGGAGAAQDGDGTALEGPKRALALQRAFSVASSIYRIRWTVDARKLVSTDREHASPSFDLSFGEPVQFKMIMRPKVINNEKGGCCFKKARGRGKILLRCLNDVESVVKPVVTFRIAVGSGNPAKQAIPRGPVRHDFSESPITGLPEAHQQWDFTKAVDKSKHTFVVCLEVMPA